MRRITMLRSLFDKSSNSKNGSRRFVLSLKQHKSSVSTDCGDSPAITSMKRLDIDTVRLGVSLKHLMGLPIEVGATFREAFNYVKELTKDNDGYRSLAVHLSKRRETKHLVSKTPAVFVSYAWDANFKETLQAISQTIPEGEDDVFVWMDIASTDLSSLDEDDQRIDKWALTLQQLLPKFTKVLVVLAPFEKPIVLERAWFYLEVLCAELATVDVVPCMGVGEKSRMFTAMRTGSLERREVASLLRSVNFEKATATRHADREGIVSFLRSRSENVHESVTAFLWKWVESFVSEAEKNEVNDTKEMACVLSSLGSFHFVLQKYDHAIDFYERALKIFATLEDSNWESARVTYDIACAYHAETDLVKAEEMYRKSLNLAESIPQDHSHFVDIWRCSLADLLVENQNFNEAEKLFQQVFKSDATFDKTVANDIVCAMIRYATMLKTKGDYNQAEAILNMSLDVAETSLGPNDEAAANSYSNLGLLFQEKGDYFESEKFFRKALAIQKFVFGSKSPEVAITLGNLSLSLRQRGDYDSAESFSTESYAIYSSSDHPKSGSLKVRAQSIRALNLGASGDLEGAEKMFLDIINTLTKLHGKRHPELATAKNNLGALMEEKRAFPAAEKLYREALEIDIKAKGLQHLDVARDKTNLARLLFKFVTSSKKDSTVTGKEIESLLRDALAIRQKVFGDEHPEVINGLHDIAEVLRLRGDLNGAEPLYRQAIELSEKLYGRENVRVAAILKNLATLLLERSEFDSAEKLFKEAFENFRDEFGPGHVVVASSATCLAELYRVKGDQDTSKQVFAEWLKGAEVSAGEAGLTLRKFLYSLAQELESRGELKAAEYLLRDAVELTAQERGTREHVEVLEGINSLVTVLVLQEELAAAVPLYRECIHSCRKLLGDEHPFLASTLLYLANVLRKKGDHDEAETVMQQVLELKRQNLGSNNIEFADVLHDYALYLIERSKLDVAEPLLKEAEDIYRIHRSAELVLTLNTLANLYKAKDDATQAEEYYSFALSEGTRYLGKKHDAVVKILEDRADFLHRVGRHSESEACYREAIDILKANHGELHPDVAFVLLKLAESLKETNPECIKAARLGQEGIGILDITLGTDHPETQRMWKKWNA